MVDRICPNCQKTYQVNPTRLKHGRGIYCSRDCSYEARGVARQRRVVLICARCNKSFERTVRAADATKTSYCSAECLHPHRPTPVEIATIAPTTLAWFAGIIDGEGCIHIRRDTQNGQHIPMYSLALRVSMCHEPTVRRLQEIFGLGHITIPNRPKISRNPSWAWATSSHETGQILEAILPYLVTKREEADLALRFLQETRTTYNNRPVPDDVRALRESFYQQLREAKPRWRFYQHATPSQTSQP